MESSRGVLIGLALLLVAGGIAALSFFAYRSHTQAPTPVGEQPQEAAGLPPASFHSSELKISFDYPQQYHLDAQTQGNGERMWVVMKLVDSEVLQSAVENGASEGPPAIALQIFDNPEQYTLEQWVKNVSYSNYKLASDPTLAPVTVGGVPGLSYRYSGLFETNATVVEHAGNIYLFSVDWLTPGDANLKDFPGILNTVHFD